uniref:Phospholipase B1, membrane-associated n=1 Tax=Sander lucioperca TaxID=283035 RepID=A0A8C9ZD99_SANLU
KVVAAVGDSLTAGNGIASSPNNILDVLSQYRGLSWSIGGDENLTTVTTLPNILKHFNHNLTGYSVGKGEQQTPQAFLNQAVAGAKSKDIPKQVRALVARMKNDSRINFELDWKVITLFIGGNDICDHCYNSLLYSEENYIRNVRDSLDYLHKEMPRALVNLVEPLHIIPLREMHSDTSLKCPTWIMCPCVILPLPNSKALLTHSLSFFKRLLHELVESGRYDTRSDFTVVVQIVHTCNIPFPQDGRADRSFFSADCFHLSQKRAHAEMAIALWNNMLEPVGRKQNYNNFTYDRSKIHCPSEVCVEIFRVWREIPLLTSYYFHELRPGDIKVVAAVGDSLTVSNFVILSIILSHNFNVVFCVFCSIGGDENLTTVTTLPNILKHFNHNLTGYSVGKGEQQTPQAFLNQAVAGAKSKDIPKQVRALVARMKNDSRINFELDWKVITLFIGGNDICDHCYNSLLYSEENYIRNVRDSLDYLHKEMPRALVNLVEPLHIIPLREVGITPWYPFFARIMCPCVILPLPNSKALQKVEDINRNYQCLLHELVESGRYDTRSDFTVVVQPFFRRIVVPRLPDGRADCSFFSADCFHLSQKAQTLMARSLWNNMNWGSDFSCVDLTPSDTVPTSVHKLRPADIKVVAALGDSTTKPAVRYFSAGTFFIFFSSDILKKFNPFIKGFSKGQGSRQKFFNMAVPGAKTSYEVNFEKDWKIVTIFVGGNDLCNYCIDQVSVLIKMNVFVSCFLILYSLNTLGCSLLQRFVLSFSLFFPQAEIEHLISGNRYEGKEDFAVVLQPFLHNSFIPYIGEGEVDSNFFSVDCFHISERAHAEMAIALWNNMLEPVGRKQNYNNFTYDRSKIHCPSESCTNHPCANVSLLHACWVPVIVGIVSLLAGIVFAWLILSSCQRRKNKVEKAVEMKGTAF